MNKDTLLQEREALRVLILQKWKEYYSKKKELNKLEKQLNTMDKRIKRM